MIRPTITEVVDDSFLARIEVWGSQSSGAIRDSDELSSNDNDGDTVDADALEGLPS